MIGARNILIPHNLLVELYRTAVAAALPGPALEAALDRLDALPERVHLFALGKAAAPMAETATRWLERRGSQPAGGVVVASEVVRTPHATLVAVRGDHPFPNAGSLAAAEWLAGAASRVRPEDEAWVLLSGGTSSLIGAPVSGVAPPDYHALFVRLLRSGMDITAMNLVRKRVSAWSAGRLAAALAPARVRVFAVSDVIGDDPATIGSGPCAPDASTAAEVRALLESHDLWRELPGSVRDTIAAAERDPARETPKPNDPVFARVITEVIVSNRVAVRAAVEQAVQLGWDVRTAEQPLRGEAARVGVELGRLLASEAPPEHGVACWIWGGETTVTLGPATGSGGRCQELALAAARELAHAGTSNVALLAAGTDGRDGPTDAAGALVDSTTWHRVVAAGRDPDRDLATHDAYAALDAAGALFRPGATGTNVMDVVVGVRVGSRKS